MSPKGFEGNISPAGPAHGSSGPCSDPAAPGLALAGTRFVVGTSSVSSSPTMKPQQLLQLFQQREIHPASGQISPLWGCHTAIKKLQGGSQAKAAPGLGQERGARSLRLLQPPSSHCIASTAEPGDKGVTQHWLLGAELLSTWAGID